MGLLDCNYVLGGRTQVVKELCYASVTIIVIAEGADSLNLSQGDSYYETGGFVIA